MPGTGARPVRLAGPHVALVPDPAAGSGTSAGDWLVVVDGAVVGDCGWSTDGHDPGEVAVHGTIAVAHRRAGWGTEAAAVLTGWAERQPGVRLLVARVAPEDRAGLRLLARLGFVEHASHPPALRLVRPAPGAPRPRGRHVC